MLSQTLEADLAKLAASRSSIDGLVAGQVEKLAEGRDILKRALESMIAQTWENWVCDVYDDDPAASGRAVCEALGDPRIQSHALLAQGDNARVPTLGELTQAALEEIEAKQRLR